VYATWNESLDYYDELGTPTVGNISEALVENHTNDTPASAQLIAMGNMVRGKFIDVNDFDYFKFNGTAGQTIVCYLDSLDSAAYISFRLICSDGVTFMGASGLGTGSQCFLVFTLPSNGQYYLRLADINGTTGGYRFRTQLNVLGPERGRDCRDIFVSSSTNISSWSTPVRVNQDDALYDNWLPEVIVDGKNGRPYVAWLDWRDTPGANCGGFSHVYLARSDNGGAAWTEVGIITTAQSNWTNELGNLIPNQGDYIALAADSAHIGACWSDARDGNANVYTSLMTILVTPVAASLVSADAQPDRVLLRWFAAGSEGGLAAVQRRDADVFASADAGWVTLADVPVGGNGLVIYEDASVVAGRTYEYRLGLDDGGTQGFAGLARVSIPLRPSLSIAGITPNPVRNEMLVEFALPNADPARLNVYDISGRLVRTREVSFGPGRHRTSLDARSLGAGVYLVEVTQAGHRATTRASVVR
jgi:hypothetical protein